MSKIIKAQRGTVDILPDLSYKWRYLEQAFSEVAQSFGYKEIRTPTFEATELFCKSVGETTDVVQKEMYTFTDKKGRSITLRPEGTAGAVRAAIENSLLFNPLPLKMYYITSAFRYEKPQAGRLREFHQLGVEILGANEPVADIRLIDFGRAFFERLGIKNLSLEINSIGCPSCREAYHSALKSYFGQKKQDLCGICLERLDKNPMRILDCKVPSCEKINQDAPVIVEFLCDECNLHFEEVKLGLERLRIDYEVNPQIVRGLDYYTRTVFEFVTDEIGAQGTVCGGGRYNGLVKSLGGPDVSGLGFALGVERLLLLMDKLEIKFPNQEKCLLYVCNTGGDTKYKALEIASKLNRSGKYCECDETGRSLKAQMKYADKIGAKYTVVIGDEEILKGVIILKNMETGESSEQKLDNVENWFSE